MASRALDLAPTSRLLTKLQLAARLHQGIDVSKRIDVSKEFKYRGEVFV
jgi:hypothetical protein